MAKSFLRLLGLALALFIHSALADDLQDIRARGVLRHLGIPYANFVTGSGDGFDVELMQGFARELGVRYEFVQSNWNDVIGDLTGKEIRYKPSVQEIGSRPVRGDVIANGMTILPPRLKLLDFSETVELDLQPKKYAVNEAVNNVDPEILLTVNKTPARASQTGFAVGATGYPDPAVVCPDTFAGAGIYKTVDVVRRVSPKARGSAASAEEFRIEWRKEFVSASALTANPAPWPAGT